MFILSAALMSLFLPLFAAPVQAQNAAVSLNIEVGFEGYFRSEGWLPILIRVANGGADISGELRVMSVDVLGKTSSAYIAPLELPTQSDKRLFMYIPPALTAQTIRVELVTPERIVAAVNRDLKSTRSSDMLFVVVTDSPRGSIDLKGMRSGMGDSYQANWRAENLPRLAEAMRGLNALILTDTDTGILTSDQRLAIADWVLSGGHLVVTGGVNWQKTQVGVTDLLPIRPERTTTLTSMPNLAAFAGQTYPLAAPGTAPIVVATGDLTRDAQVLITQGGVPLLVRRYHGAGIVDYLTFDPNLEPFSSWGDRASLWFTLFTTTGQRPSWAAGVQDSEQARVAADMISGLRFPDVMQLAIFLGIYITLVGPVNYLVLRRIGRREWAWVTIPLVVIGFAVIYYLTGASLRGTQAVVSRMTLVQVWENMDRGQVDSVIGVAVPRRGQYSFSVAPGFTLRTLEEEDFGSLVSTKGIDIYEVGSYEARNFLIDAGTTAPFVSSGFVRAVPLEGRAEIVLPAAQEGLPTPVVGSSGTQIMGTVRNTTGQTLLNVVVLAMGGSQELGTLEPGETRTFVFDMRATQSPPISLGSGNWATAYFRAGRTLGSTSNMTMRQIMGTRYLVARDPFSGRGFENFNDQQEDFRRQRFLEAIIVDADPSGGRGTDVYVAGWTETSPLPINLTGVPYVTEDSTLYLYRLPVTVRAAEQNTIVEMPNAYLTWTPTEESTRRDVAPYEVSIQPNERYIFRYVPMPLMRLSEVTEIRLTVQPSTGASRQVTDALSLWNWQTQQWEMVRIENFLTQVINPTRFIGPQNAIEMKLEITAETPINRLGYERIDLTLYGKLSEESSK